MAVLPLCFSILTTDIALRTDKDSKYFQDNELFEKQGEYLLYFVKPGRSQTQHSAKSMYAKYVFNALING